MGLDREVARRRGQRKVAAMKRRTGQLRRRVVATAMVGFVLLWTVVFVQMATGNDPALGGGGSARPRAGRGPDRERRSPQATVPQPSEEGDEESSPVEEPEVSETAGIEAERAEAERLEAEQLEIEQQEAEARELEELEPVVTGQS
ncbi:MAG TPA: hypothetical protein VFL77_08035 [Solirubrobacterales bacterium]|nr:hypothetical protein [Solirubrobacterales bacterium]